jgi:hypothetical protein
MEGEIFDRVILKGQRRVNVAKALGVAKSTVTKNLKRVEARVLGEMAETTRTIKAVVLQRYEYVYGEAIAAFEASKGTKKRRRDQQTVHEVTAGPGPGQDGPPATVIRDPLVTAVETEESYGDPRYLSEAMRALEAMRNVYGLDAPKRLNLTPVDRPLEAMPNDELDQELRRAYAELDAMPAVKQIGAGSTTAAQALTDAQEGSAAHG